MKIFDPHIHMTSRTTDDYRAMSEAGIVAIVEPAFWLGQPRTHVATFEDYFLSLLGWERFRASQFGIHHFCTMGLNPKEANNPRIAQGVLDLLPRYLEKDNVVAVGEIGYDDQTQAEERIFAAQIELAKTHALPVLVHTPHRDKKRGTERSIALVKELFDGRAYFFRARDGVARRLEFVHDVDERNAIQPARQAIELFGGVGVVECCQFLQFAKADGEDIVEYRLVQIGEQGV